MLKMCLIPSVPGKFFDKVADVHSYSTRSARNYYPRCLHAKSSQYLKKAGIE